MASADLLGVKQVDTRLSRLQLKEMLREALQFRLELDDGLDVGADVDVVVVGLRCRLEAPENGSTVRVRAVNDNHLRERHRSGGEKGFSVNICVSNEQRRRDHAGGGLGRREKVNKVSEIKRWKSRRSEQAMEM